jgi:dCTP deaminase
MNYGRNGELGLFPISDDFPPRSNIVGHPSTGGGIIPYQGLVALIHDKVIDSLEPITPDQIQPASIDLRLGPRAYRVRASFLPGPTATVMERVRELDGMPQINLTAPTVFERGAVYVVELMESVNLPGNIEGLANPKSSTGRLDVLTRLITDRGTAFDRIDPDYHGPLYLEVAPLTFSVIVRQGTRLNQVRFQRGRAAGISPSRFEQLYNEGQFARVSEGELFPLRGRYVPVSVDLLGTGGGAVGYKAKQNASKIDVDLVAHYEPQDFWEKVTPNRGRLDLNKGDFYILGTREEVGVPPEFAAEMIPYDAASGEFRVHYAGFFDPGFGWDRRAGGSKAVLEVRSHGVSFTLEHGQIVGWLNYIPIATGRTDKVYGAAINSHYQGQGVTLSKHFRPFPS